MSDKKLDCRAISLLSVTLIVLLTLVSVLSAVALVEHFHENYEPVEKAVSEKPSKNDHVSLEMQYEIAVHESGHAVMDQLQFPERPIERIWLYTERPQSADCLGRTEWGEIDSCFAPEVMDRSIAVVFLGGLAAEQVILDMKPPEVYGDKDSAGEKILEYCEIVACECPSGSSRGGQCLQKDVMRAERDRLYAEAARCIEANKGTVVSLANLLFRREVAEAKSTDPLDLAAKGWRRSLEDDDLKKFFSEHPLVACQSKDVIPASARGGSASGGKAGTQDQTEK